MKKSELEQSETCTVCGKEYRPAELVWVADALLCPLCLVEEESCGCSD
ncbi:MAG: hypothetical protein KKH22_06170 [Proteobacteria bacterium]|nr:hypothetical protein [Pseudomonadota bacterium]